jgi:DNA-binding MarR family transcriptional regulator
MAKPRNDGFQPLADPMAARLGYQLRRVSMSMMADLAARLVPLGLRPAEATILLLLCANAGCRQGEIGESLGIKRANMVPLIARLVDAGLVVRARADGRSHALSLTSKGEARVAAINRILDRQEAQFESRLDGKSLEVLLRSLAVLRSAGEQDD